MRGAIYKRYLRWCDEQNPRAAPLPIPAFWMQFEPLCDRVKINMRERGGKVFFAIHLRQHINRPAARFFAV
jgi:hypothetical protein